MIVPRVFTYLDIEVTISLVAFFISWLLPEIPVRHIATTSRCKKILHITEDSRTFYSCLKMMERCKKEDSIKTSSSYQWVFTECEHITYSKLRIWMESSSFFDHTRWAIESEIPFQDISTIFCFFEKSPIPASDIKDTLISLLLHIFDNKIQLWPGMILSTFWECMSKIIVGHSLFEERFPSFEIVATRDSDDDDR